MVCTFCGYELVEGQAFCTHCGAQFGAFPEMGQTPSNSPVTGDDMDTQILTPQTDRNMQNAQPYQGQLTYGYDATQGGYQDVNMPNSGYQGANMNGGMPYGMPMNMNPQVGGYTPQGTQPKQKKIKQKNTKESKNSNKKAVIAVAIVAAVVLLCVVGFVVSRVFLKSDDVTDIFVTYSDGEFDIITNLTGDDGIQFGTIYDSDYVNTASVQFSPDGTYIYFFSGTVSSNYCATLCRVKYADISIKNEGNTNIIENIDSNVDIYSCTPMVQGVIYENSNGQLIYYDGESRTVLCENVSTYYTDGENRVIFTVDISGGEILYGVDLSDKTNKTTLCEVETGYLSLESHDDFDNIICAAISYDSYSEDGYIGSPTNYSLYKCSLSTATATLITDSYNSVYWIDGDSLYYTTVDEDAVCLADYVTDSTAEADADITAPDTDDYWFYIYDYVPVHSYDEDDIEEILSKTLYTSCAEDVEVNDIWYYANWYEVNSDDYDEDSVYYAYYKFYKKYASEANEDGYIEVTSEVMAALKDLNRATSSEENSDEEIEYNWLFYCYTYEPYVSDWDEEAYGADYELYSQYADRIELRETVQSTYIDTYNLYKYENGTSELVIEDLVDHAGYVSSYADSCNGNTFIYMTLDNMPDLDLCDADSLSDFTSIDASSTSNMIYNFATGDTYQANDGVAQLFSDNNPLNAMFADIFILDNRMYVESNGELVYFTIANGEVSSSYTLLSSSGFISYVTDDNKVYYKDTTTDDYYGRLCCTSEDGGDIVLCDSVYRNSIRYYEDGYILVETYRSSTGVTNDYKLISATGDEQFSVSNVKSFKRVDDTTFLYISGGNLYIYDPSGNICIKDDVTMIWSFKSMSFE